MTIVLLLPAVFAVLGTLIYFVVGPSPDPRGVRQWALAMFLAGMIGVCMGVPWGSAATHPTAGQARR